MADEGTRTVFTRALRLETYKRPARLNQSALCWVGYRATIVAEVGATTPEHGGTVARVARETSTSFSTERYRKMRLGSVSDSLGGLSFDEMLDQAVRLGVSGTKSLRW